MRDTPDSEKLKKMRERIESLRGLCKTAVGYLRDENAFHQADQIANLIGDMEPTRDSGNEGSDANWIGLTDNERNVITDKVIGFNSCVGWEDDYAKAIEAKLKEKNGG